MHSFSHAPINRPPCPDLSTRQSIHIQSANRVFTYLKAVSVVVAAVASAAVVVAVVVLAVALLVVVDAVAVVAVAVLAAVAVVLLAPRVVLRSSL